MIVLDSLRTIVNPSSRTNLIPWQETDSERRCHNPICWKRIPATTASRKGSRHKFCSQECFGEWRRGKSKWWEKE